jgi:hypothetical protein
MFKMQAAYELPYKLQLSGDWQVLSGRPIFTSIRTPSGLLKQGRYDIEDVPRGDQTVRAPTLDLLDIRLQRDFAFQGSRKLSLAFSILNTLNDGAFFSVASTRIPSSTTPPGYLTGVTYVPPQRVQIVAKVWF